MRNINVAAVQHKTMNNWSSWKHVLTYESAINYLSNNQQCRFISKNVSSRLDYFSYAQLVVIGRFTACVIYISHHQ